MGIGDGRMRGPGEVIERLPAGVEVMKCERMVAADHARRREIGDQESIALSGGWPGPRAQRLHWALGTQAAGFPGSGQDAGGRDMGTGRRSVLPAAANVCRHVAGLKALGVESMMLRWTLGGHPSPNIRGGVGGAFRRDD
jgi:hypothetical protein